MQDLDSAIEVAKGSGTTPLELPGVACTPPRSESRPP